MRSWCDGGMPTPDSTTPHPAADQATPHDPHPSRHTERYNTCRKCHQPVPAPFNAHIDNLGGSPETGSA